MRTDVRRCNAHNVIHGLRETCPRCAEAKRAEVLAKAGPRATKPGFSSGDYYATGKVGDSDSFHATVLIPYQGAKTVTLPNPPRTLPDCRLRPCPSPWENVPPYPESRYEPNTLAAQVSAAVARLSQTPTVILPMQDSMDYGQICRLVLEQGLQPAWVSFGRQGAVEISHPRRNYITAIDQDEGRLTMAPLTEAEARAKGFSWEDRPEAYTYESVPFSPETFCPPGREALERAGYECRTVQYVDRDAVLLQATNDEHPIKDARHLEQELPGERVFSGDQAERFLAFAWETMALDAGLDGILAMIEDEE